MKPIGTAGLSLSKAATWRPDSRTASRTARSNPMGPVAITRTPAAFLARLALMALWLPVAVVLAVPMQNDPNGFEGIPWGAAFSESDTFVKVEDSGRAQTYELKGIAPTLGSAPVDSMRFNTIDGGFARVTVRYNGKE